MKVESAGMCPECDEVFNIKANRGACPCCCNSQYIRLDSLMASSQKATELLSQLTKAVKDSLITVTNNELNAIVDEAAQHLKKGGW